MQVLFENKFYRATLMTPGPQAAGTIVHFMPLGWVDDETGFRDFEALQADNFITRIGYRAVFVQSSRNDWYTRRSAKRMARIIGRKLRGKGPILSYGTSMGGFGAIAHAERIGADRFFVASPQASLCNAYMSKIGDTRWTSRRDEFRADPIRTGRCRNGRGIVAYDPALRTDTIHARTILSETRSFAIESPGTGHFSMVRFMREIGFAQVMRQIFARIDDDEALAQWAEEVSELFRNSVAAQFMSADDSGREALLKEHGAVALLHAMPAPVIADRFKRSPTESFAVLLIDLMAQMKAEVHVDYVKRAIVAAKLGHLLKQQQTSAD